MSMRFNPAAVAEIDQHLAKQRQPGWFGALARYGFFVESETDHGERFMALQAHVVRKILNGDEWIAVALLEDDDQSVEFSDHIWLPAGEVREALRRPPET